MARSRPVILDDDDPPPRRSSEMRERSRDSFEWGLASTLIGSTFLMLAPLVLLLMIASPRSSYDDVSMKFDTLYYLGVFGAVILCIVGFLFGRHGGSRAYVEQTSAALPVAGMLLCLAAVLLWLLTGFAILARSSTW